MFRIKFRPNRKLKKLIDTNFNNSSIQPMMKRVEDEILKYWKQNIYTYFDARLSLGYTNTGQMGDSLLVQTKGTSINMFMLPIHNERTQWIKMDFPRMPSFSSKFSFSPISMPSAGMGRQMDIDYGKLMREGFSPSPGAYDPSKDCRVRTGNHPGYDKTTRWDPWSKDFIGAVKQIVADEWMKELKAAGVSLVKPWRVDIVI
jgi:hypothetical protein